jgi:hypothetical protein
MTMEDQAERLREMMRSTNSGQEKFSPAKDAKKSSIFTITSGNSGVRHGRSG